MISPQEKLKQLSVIFILNQIISSLITQKTWSCYMTLLVYKRLNKLIQLLVTCVRFLFSALFVVIWEYISF